MLVIDAYDLPKKLAKGSWLPKNSLKTSSGLRNVKVNPGKSDGKSELEDPGKWSRANGVRWVKSKRKGRGRRNNIRGIGKKEWIKLKGRETLMKETSGESEGRGRKGNTNYHISIPHWSRVLCTCVWHSVVSAPVVCSALTRCTEEQSNWTMEQRTQIHIRACVWIKTHSAVTYCQIGLHRLPPVPWTFSLLPLCCLDSCPDATSMPVSCTWKPQTQTSTHTHYRYRTSITRMDRDITSTVVSSTATSKSLREIRHK